MKCVMHRSAVTRVTAHLFKGSLLQTSEVLLLLLSNRDAMACTYRSTASSKALTVAMFLFDYPVVNSCFFCCLSCPVCMEAMYCCSAMPCVPELLRGNFAPLPADKSDWHIHQFVRVHIPLDIASNAS